MGSNLLRVCESIYCTVVVPFFPFVRLPSSGLTCWANSSWSRTGVSDLRSTRRMGGKPAKVVKGEWPHGVDDISLLLLFVWLEKEILDRRDLFQMWTTIWNIFKWSDSGDIRLAVTTQYICTIWLREDRSCQLPEKRNTSSLSHDFLFRPCRLSHCISL